MKEVTFKEYVDAYAMRRRGHVKGMVVMIKIFDLEKDGPYWEEGRGLSGRKYDRTYVYARIRDFLIERCKSGDFMDHRFDLPNGKYLVAITTKRNSKKYESLIEFGFEPAINLEERRKDILKAMAS